MVFALLDTLTLCHLRCIYDSLVGAEADSTVETVGLLADALEEVIEIAGVGTLFEDAFG